MPYVVTQACCADASCVVACPVNCIHPAPGEPGFAEAEMLHVDGTSCVDCGACASACPVDAIKPHSALSAAEQPFVAINAAYYDCFPHADRTPLAPVAEQRRLRRRGPFRVAVVGAGPAGLYTADELLKHPEVSVDVIDRLPTPYGLVRAGVAPDHPHTKRVERLFAAIEDQPGFRYRLGVEVGRDVTLADLEREHDAVVYCVGAASDRSLGIAGEQLRGSLSATEVVGWYNGHPDARDLDVPLDHDRAVVVGNGNVALDVARLLARPAADLVATDVAPHALAALTASAVREVVVLGRRGPAQAAFTVPELVGLVGLVDTGAVDVVVEAPAGSLDDGAAEPGDRHRLRLLADLASRVRTPGRPAVVLRFCAQPVGLLDDGTGRVGAVEVARTRLVTTPDGDVVAEPTGECEVLACGLVLRSVGYRGLPVVDLPHDPATGTVPHVRGRVRPGVYVAGWVKRGPNGFIGTNKADAEETVASLLDDLDAGWRRVQPDREGAGTATWAAVDVLDLADWRALDHEERRRGATRGAPREKVVDPDEAVAVALAARPRPRVRSRLRLTEDPARGSRRGG